MIIIITWCRAWRRVLCKKFFLEVRRVFFEKNNMRLFCSRHRISKLKNREADNII